MKKTRTCPACSGREIYLRVVSARGSHGPDLLPKLGGFFRGPKLELYVCGTCGYAQFYVPEELLSPLRERYERAL